MGSCTTTGRLAFTGLPADLHRCLTNSLIVTPRAAALAAEVAYSFSVSLNSNVLVFFIPVPTKYSDGRPY
jgi:hypothetical protein